nr:U3 small nucleolar RNA-associated protein 4 homolog isoform X3 [Peromyscus maniculatus bairdii]
MGEFKVHRVRFFNYVPSGIRCVAYNNQSNRLAVSRTDGTVEIYNLSANYFQEKFFPGHESRATEALCWAEGQRLFSAGLNGEILEYDLQALNIKYALDAFGGPIWSMTASPSGSQLLQEDSFVVGTAEGTVFHFQLVSVTSNSSEKQWVRTKPFQHHTHDVRTVAHSPTALISGGTDTHLVIRPLMEKVEVKNYDAALRKITFPHRRLISCSKKRQLLLFQFAHHLELWRLGSTVATGKNGDTLPLSKNADHLLHLKTKGPENIICSCVSPCGSWIAYSTASRFFLYRLKYERDNISLQRVSKMPAFLRSALHILFSEDSAKLFVASSQGSLHVIRLLEGSFKHLHTFQPQSGTVEAMCLLAVSPDGNWLAASGTSAGVHVYDLNHLKLHCTVPAYNFPVTALAIAPSTNNLVIAHSDQQVFEFSIPDKQYTEWSRNVQKQGFHQLWLQRDTPITHISFHPKRPMHILLHDAYMFCIIDKSLPLPNDKTVLYNPLPPKNESDVFLRRTAHAFKMSKKYKPLLFMDLLDERTLVAVERPLDDIIAQLPPPIKKKKFGT